jgi:N-acetylmuramoyl-L-alanine amidase
VPVSYRITTRAVAIAVGLCCWSCQYQHPDSRSLATMSRAIPATAEGDPASAAWPDSSQSVNTHADGLQVAARRDFSPFPAALELDRLVARSIRQRQPLIALDPGHGGQDPGAVTAAGLYEKDIALTVAQECARRLRERGFRVMLTRSDDRYLSLQQRVDLAVARQAGMFISIHANAAWNPDARGAEVFYYGGMFAPAESADLADACFQSLLPVTPWPDRAVKAADYHVLRENPLPAALVELGFMTNAEEVANLASPLYQADLASALADAIEGFSLSREGEVVVARRDQEPQGPW